MADPRRTAVQGFLALVILVGPVYVYVRLMYYPTPDADIGVGLGIMWTLLIGIPMAVVLIVRHLRRRTASRRDPHSPQ